MITRYVKVDHGSRKFALAILIVAIASLLVVLRLLEGDEWVDVVGATMLFFGASNVGEHFAKCQESQ